MTITATYSPDDNKIRLYASARLDPDTYARVRAAGFIWAPKQDLFVAPMWTPEREDLAVELAGSIEDEDTSLTERAEERAERFEGYSDNRREDAERAHAAVSAIADGIPFGQPILVGHHSERHARRDAERIENGMRRAVNAFKTSQYWKSRAAGALRHAKYKELTGVRARRIKGLEADRRKQQTWIERSDLYTAAWSRLGTKKDGTPIDPRTHAVIIANQDGGTYGERTLNSGYVARVSLWEASGGNIDGKPFEEAAIATVEDVRAKALQNHASVRARAARWVEHYDNRLTYERALLADGGGLITDRTEYPIVPGGQVLIGRDGWVTVIRVNRQDGRIVSVTTNARYVRVRGIETVQDYRPPTLEQTQAVKAATKLAPLVNVNGDGFRQMTAAEYTRMSNDYKSTKTYAATETAGRYRQRTAFAGGGVCRVVAVFLTDKPVVPVPPPTSRPTPPPVPPPTPPAPTSADLARVEATSTARAERDADAAPFEAMAASLRAGVQTVTAPALFPTPPDVAARMIELADVAHGQKILEPSAGTGAILEQLAAHPAALGPVVAVEINPRLAERLRARFPVAATVRCTDFLTCNGDLGTFDRIVMNPPFDGGADITHVRHALGMLNPGGRLVAICAAGPRQHAAFAGVGEWRPLPDGTFAGTSVRAAIIVIDK